jgi:hypothetical protein
MYNYTSSIMDQHTNNSHNNKTHLVIDSNPSICIPRISSDIQQWKIRIIFEKLHIGKIYRIDQIFNHNTNTKRIFIHFDFWYKNERSKNVRKILFNNEHVNVIYDDFHFWKCYLSKNPKK